MLYMLTLYIPGYLRGESRADKEGGESFKSLFVEVGPVLQARPLYTEMYYVFGGKKVPFNSQESSNPTVQSPKPGNEGAGEVDDTVSLTHGSQERKFLRRNAGSVHCAALWKQEA